MEQPSANHIAAVLAMTEVIRGMIKKIDRGTPTEFLEEMGMSSCARGLILSGMFSAYVSLAKDWAPDFDQFMQGNIDVMEQIVKDYRKTHDTADTYSAYTVRNNPSPN